MSNPTHDDGGPAFPGPDDYSQDGRPLYGPGFQGMTLRDWFAGQAVSALSTAWNSSADTRQQLVAECYEIADAMIAARKESHP